MNPDSLSMNAKAESLSTKWIQPEALHARLSGATLGTSEKIKAISEAASNLLHADADQGTLLHYLLQYQSTLSTLPPALDNRLVGLMLPPNKQDVDFHSQCSQLYANLAGVCQRIIREAPQELYRNREDLKWVTLACYWAIRFLSERLRCAYCSYTHAPAEIWLEIHQIYQHSRAHGIANNPVHEGSKLRHVTHVYKRVLLFGICDPYQFPFRSVNSVFTALDDWAKLVHLRLGKPSKDQCLFLISPNVDRPAVPILPKLSLGVDTLYLDTSALIDVLNLDLNTHVDFGFKSSNLGRELEVRQMLKNLIVGWGVPPARESEREFSGGTCDLVVGLDSVTALISLKHEQIDDTRIPIREGLKLIDESASGVRVCIADTDDTHVRVGELVAMKNSRTDGWSIGMIRWGQTDIDNRFCMGIFKFADNVAAITINVHNEQTNVSFGPVTAIWAIHKRAGEQIPTLIIDTRFYRPEQIIRVDCGGVPSFFETGQVILSTRDFIWFELSALDSNPGPETHFQQYN